MSRESLRTEGIAAEQTLALDLLPSLGLATSHIGYMKKGGVEDLGCVGIQ